MIRFNEQRTNSLDAGAGTVAFMYVHVCVCLGILPIFYVFDLRRLCFLFKQSTHIISVHNILGCLVLMSLTNYVQFILCANILTDILKFVFGMLFMFIIHKSTLRFVYGDAVEYKN